MDFNYSKRGYLLPKGCKDLIDALNLNPSIARHEQKLLAPSPPGAMPPTVGGIFLLPVPTSVLDLANLLGQHPSRIIADLMKLGVFAKANQIVNFETAAKVALKYGYLAKPASL